MGRLKTVLRSVVADAFEKRPRFRSVGSLGLVLGRDVEGLHHVRFGGKNAVGARTIFAGPDIEIGYATTVGSCNYLHGPLTIGKYCQLAPNVAIYGADHPTRFMTTYVNANLLGSRLRPLARVEPVTLGHDVWIGHGAVLLRGVSIGTGSIVGAGAVVTKSADNYCVLSGNPAAVRKRRFSEPVIGLLEELRWWDLGEDQMRAIEGMFFVDLVDDELSALEALRFAVKRVHRLQEGS
jgi:acetyltransferase-like isoleucine patch superfamily enzyme